MSALLLLTLIVMAVPAAMGDGYAGILYFIADDLRPDFLGA